GNRQIDQFVGYHEAPEFIKKLLAALKKSIGAADQASDSRDSENINDTTNLEAEEKRLENLSQARIAQAHTGIAHLETALAEFYMDCGRFPISNEGLDALQLSPPDLLSLWDGPYIKESKLFDPWQNLYIYKFPAAISDDYYDLISYGADGVPGGEGVNTDILNR
ncbi:type II secretion system protein GspG, partial [Planctomycetota bacterium]